MVGKIYAGILVDRVCKVTGGLIDDEQGGFRVGRGCVDQIFTLKQIDEKTQGKKCKVYVGFIDLEKAYNRVNREALWQVLRMYDVGGEGIFKKKRFRSGKQREWCMIGVNGRSLRGNAWDIAQG